MKDVVFYQMSVETELNVPLLAQLQRIGYGQLNKSLI